LPNELALRDVQVFLRGPPENHGTQFFDATIPSNPFAPSKSTLNYTQLLKKTMPENVPFSQKSDYKREIY